MESCAYRIKTEEGDRRCGSTFNSKEVEFRHPDYKDLSQRIYLCQSHFHFVFGEPIAKKDSLLPLELDKWLELRVKVEKKAYDDHVKDIRKKVRNGIGYDYFDWELFYKQASNKLNLAKEKLSTLRRNMCRFEWCNAKLTDFRKMYVIRIYPKNPREYINLYFCCLDHWEVFKKRIGLQTLKGKLDTSQKKASFTLDHYNGVVQ